MLITALVTALVGLGTVVGQTAVAATPGSITGTVTNTAGLPLSGVRISVETRTTTPGGAETWTEIQATPALTDAAGRYTVSVPPTAAGAEGYVVGFHATGHATRYHAGVRNREQATRLTVTDGQQRSGINAQLPRVGTVGGTVTNTAGEPIAGVTVTTLELSVSATGVRTWRPVTGATGFTNTAGVYRLEAPAGQYRMRFSAPGGFETRFFPAASHVEEGEYVAVTAGEVTSPIDVELPKLARVLGSLVEPNGKLTADTATVELWRQVTLADEDESELDDLPDVMWEQFGSDVVSNGTFTIDVAAGSYRVKVLLDDGSAGFMPGYVGLDAAQDLTLAPEQTVRQPAYVLPAESIVSGRVATRAGEGLKDFVVQRQQGQVEQIFDGVPVQPVQLSSWREASSTTTDVDGRWSMRVRNSSYRFGATGEVGDDPVLQWYDEVSAFRDATDVVVNGTTTGIDFGFGPTAITAVRDPWISGHNKAGGTLTAHLGDWSPSNATLTVQWYADGELLLGETGLTYEIPAGGLGGLLGATSARHHIVVTGTDTTGRDPGRATSVAAQPFTTPALTGGNPALENRALPQVDGTARVGTPLTSTTGQWSVTPGALTREWLVNGVAVAGATGATYTPTAADLGKTVQVRVTEASGATATSRATGEVGHGTLTSVTAPTITGTARVGSPLAATPGTWSVSGTTHSYQWFRDGVTVPGATAAQFTPGVGSEGARFSVAVTAAAPGYHPATSRSALTAPVASSEIVNTELPKISGTATIGSTLTATNGTWDPAPTSFGHQWLRDGVPIAGATAPSHLVTTDDAGHALTVQVTARLTGREDASATSTAFDVPEVTFEPSTPIVQGAARVGGLLAIAPGPAVPAGVTEARQWLRNGVAIAGQTGTTYRLAGADLGAGLAVRITYTVGAETVVRTSVATARVTTASKVTLKLRKKGTRALVKVNAVKAGKATGEVEVTVKGTGKRFTATLSNGRTTVRLKGFSRGKHKVVVRYLGSAFVDAGKTSKRAKVGSA